MTLVFFIYIFVLGAAFGSFAGAVAWRLEKRRDFVRERSECEHCHHSLAWYDLVPVLSWLWLRGRCRYCGADIGRSALLLEVGLGAAFALSYVYWPYDFGTLGLTLFIAWLAALVALAVLFVYDLRHYLLPDLIVWPLAVLGVLCFVLRQLLESVPLSQWPVEALLALLPIAGVYGLLYAVSGGKLIGLGDVKLGIFIGLTLGWQGALVTLLLANYLGFFWALPGLLRGGLSTSSRMPFGPFLIAAAFVTFLWGDALVAWFLDLVLV